MKKVRIIGALVASSVLAIAACAGESPSSSPPGSNGGGETSATLVVAAPAVPGGFDTDALTPGTQETVFAGLNEPLMGYATTTDEDGNTVADPTQLEGRLAESWTAAADGLSYDIVLKQGVMSSFGHELTAADVKWSWDKSLAQKRTGQSLASIALVTGVEVVDTYTVRFVLSGASGLLLPTLTLGVPAIYDSVEMQAHATPDDPWALEWLKTNFAGYGPYSVGEVVVGQQATFVANPDYYLGQPAYTEVVYRQVTDPTVGAQLLKSGAIDFLEKPTAQDMKSFESDGAITSLVFPSNAEVKVIINTTMEPYTSKELRQAMMYATPVDEILDAVFEGYATPLEGPLPSTVPGFDASLWTYSYDEAKARQLLTDAGYPNGIDLTLQYAAITAWEEPLAIQLQSAWRKVGINLDLQKIPDAQMKEGAGAAARNLPLFTYADTPFVSDPAYALGVYFTPSACCDRGDYDNPAVTALLTQMAQTPDLDTRVQQAAEATKLINEDVPDIFIGQTDSLHAMKSSITGYVARPDTHARWAELQPAS